MPIRKNCQFRSVKPPGASQDQHAIVTESVTVISLTRIPPSEPISYRMSMPFDEVPKSVLAHIVDVHCHPTDSETPHDVMEALPITICAMATQQSDQSLVRNLASRYPGKVIPCFGDFTWRLSLSQAISHSGNLRQDRISPVVHPLDQAPRSGIFIKARALSTITP